MTDSNLPARADSPDARQEEAQARVAARRRRVAYRRKAAKPGPEVRWDAVTKDAFGTSSDDFASTMVRQIDVATRRLGADAPREADMNAALAVIDGIRPENETEAMLAAQMACTHALAMEMIGRTQIAGRRDAMNDYGNLAVKLLRTYTAQMEALARIQRKGDQTVRVEHVHVHAGGQAVVGKVIGAGGGGGRIGSERQPHALEPVADASVVALRGEDEEQAAVLLAGRGR